MVKHCCVKRCKSESYPGCGVSFHRFPSKEYMMQKWLDTIPESERITKNSVICSLHFDSTDFYTARLRPALKADAVPSIFPVPMNKEFLILLPRSQTVVEATPSTPEPAPLEIKVELSTPSHSDQPPAKKVSLIFKDVAVQTKERYRTPAEEELKRKLKMLRQRLKRREAKLKYFKTIFGI